MTQYARAAIESNESYYQKMNRSCFWVIFPQELTFLISLMLSIICCQRLVVYMAPVFLPYLSYISLSCKVNLLWGDSRLQNVLIVWVNLTISS